LKYEFNYAMDCKVSVIAAFLVLSLLSACGKAPENGNPVVAVAPQPGTSPATTPNPVPPTPTTPPPPVLSGPPTLWSHLASADAWNAAVLIAVRANLAKFEKARDRSVFCPGYDTATDPQRLTCWSRLISVMVKFESGFNQSSLYHEPSGGKDSVGLLMLSQGECPNAPTVAQLKNGVENIRCGAAKMAALIARDGYVTTPDNKHGAAAYWSVLRAPYTAYGLKLGKKLEILKESTKYKAVYPIVSN